MNDIGNIGSFAELTIVSSCRESNGARDESFIHDVFHFDFLSVFDAVASLSLSLT
jgi:hypothetical protein